MTSELGLSIFSFLSLSSKPQAFQIWMVKSEDVRNSSTATFTAQFWVPGLCFVTCPFSLRIMCYSHSSSARSGEQIATDSMNKLEVWNILNVQSFWVFLLNFSIHDIDHFYSSTPPKPLRRPPFAPWLMLVRLQQWSPYRQIAAIKGPNSRSNSSLACHMNLWATIPRLFSFWRGNSLEEQIELVVLQSRLSMICF